MTLQNIPSVMDLIGDGSAIAELDLETIGILLEDAKALSAAATGVSRALQGEVEHRLKDQIQAAYLREAKDTGTVHVQSEGCAVEVSRPKKVDWDQSDLKAIAARISEAGDDPAEYIETNLVVTEKRYTAWPASIQKQFEPARTVKPGNTSIKIKGIDQ